MLSAPVSGGFSEIEGWMMVEWSSNSRVCVIEYGQREDGRLSRILNYTARTNVTRNHRLFAEVVSAAETRLAVFCPWRPVYQRLR
jgi:hypothetical protein